MTEECDGYGRRQACFGTDQNLLAKRATRNVCLYTCLREMFFNSQHCVGWRVGDRGKGTERGKEGDGREGKR